MRIVICDDEENIRAGIGERIKGLLPREEVLCCGSAEELLKLSPPPDILLLDIGLPGLSGMEAARLLRERGLKTVLIFITGEEGYVFDSFDVNAFHYLVKPVSDERLDGVMKRAVAEVHGRAQGTAGLARVAGVGTNAGGGANDMSIGTSADGGAGGAGFGKNAGRGEAISRYIMLNSGGMHTRLRVEEIVYAEVFNAKVTVHTLSEDIEYYGKLKELERQAGGLLFRTHRAYLVNLGYVRRYDARSIYLKRGTALMSKRSYPLFVKALLDYNRRRG